MDNWHDLILFTDFTFLNLEYKYCLRNDGTPDGELNGVIKCGNGFTPFIRSKWTMETVECKLPANSHQQWCISSSSLELICQGHFCKLASKLHQSSNSRTCNSKLQVKYRCIQSKWISITQGKAQVQLQTYLCLSTTVLYIGDLTGHILLQILRKQKCRHRLRKVMKVAASQQVFLLSRLSFLVFSSSVLLYLLLSTFTGMYNYNCN